MSEVRFVRKCYRQQQACADRGHGASGFYLREFSNGTLHIYELCSLCGGKADANGGSLKRSDHPGWESFTVAVDGPGSRDEGCTCGWCARDAAESTEKNRQFQEWEQGSTEWHRTSARLRAEREQRLTWPEYQQYLRTPRWAAMRDHALARFDWRCAACHSPDHLHVHHRTYERVGAEYLTDLTVLCRYCHHVLHETWSRTSVEIQERERLQVSIDERILNALHEASCGLSYRQLETQLGMSRRTLEKHMAGLLRAGVLRCVDEPPGGKTWFAIDDAIERLVEIADAP